MVTFFRLIRILFVAWRYGLDELVLSSLDRTRKRNRRLWPRFGRDLTAPRGLRLRLALETLGPVFVKFGQVLSTRRDLIPLDIADELTLLQDRVPPFPSELAVECVTRGLGKHPDELFLRFEREPVASASIAQVHRAELPDGRQVAVKILRPKMRQVIDEDVRLLRALARLVDRVSADGRRLKPKEVVDEFDNYLHDELDLLREAANCSQLRRNFAPDGPRGHLLKVPEVFWDYCCPSVFTMEWMEGVPINQVSRLQAAGVDLKKLARDGVDIFFSQMFQDGFFHADMHPGNILVSIEPDSLGRYIALDFGIVGSLSDFDKNYLAQNFLAFFRRDYGRVAQLHIESGWVPPSTRQEALEAAIRGCCEPYFDRPLADISLGQVLLRLFQTSRRFNVEIQPQLVLLQKTLLNIEGLGRQLDPELDLWKTAKPYLERWMHERVGWPAFVNTAKREAEQWSQLLPELPRLLHHKLSETDRSVFMLSELIQLRKHQQQTNRLLAAGIFVLALGIVVALWALFPLW